MRDIRRLRRDALEPEKIARLVAILDENHAYRLYQSVSRLKETLSRDEAATFVFEAGSVRLQNAVTRAQFEGWIAPELTAVERALDQVLERANLEPRAIDKVFVTGGSSFVPAVRRLFAARFGVAKLEGGAEMVSIASGLAYMGQERELENWTSTI
jgi:hypothetical chaperone protein